MLLIYFIYGTVVVDSFEINDILDVGLLTSILLTFIATTLSKRISGIFSRKIEDHSKLNTNYSALVSKYPRCTNMIEYENSSKSNFVKGRKYTVCKRVTKGEEINKDKYIFPVVLEKVCNDFELDIVDCKNQYALPDLIRDNYDNIMEAHKHSIVYNQLNVRLDDYHIEGNKIVLHTSRTTYFHSLVTNRAMDYRWSSNNSVRELFSPGPFLDSFNKSKLSNHIGFNGLVETADDKLIFIHRSKNVSIGKDTLGTSIGASLKTNYALNDEGDFTLDGLQNAIMSEIGDELKIDREDYDFALNRNIVALYRDIVEGGKPQLLFYLRLKISSDDVKDKFYKSIRKSNKGKDIVAIDGKKLLFVDKRDLRDIYITPETMIIGNKVYRAMPSTAASVVMVIKYVFGW